MRPRPSLVATLGMLTGLTALCQLGPIWWPGGGYILAAAAVLPGALASALRPRRSTWFYCATALVVGMISPEEMFVYLTMTGPLGLMLGLTLDRPAWAAVPATAFVLTLGLLALPALAGIRPWGGIEEGWAPGVLVSAYGLFALVYSGIWRLLVARLWSRLAPVLPVGYNQGTKL